MTHFQITHWWWILQTGFLLQLVIYNGSGSRTVCQSHADGSPTKVQLNSAAQMGEGQGSPCEAEKPSSSKWMKIRYTNLILGVGELFLTDSESPEHTGNFPAAEKPHRMRTSHLSWTTLIGTRSPLIKAGQLALESSSTETRTPSKRTQKETVTKASPFILRQVLQQVRQSRLWQETQLCTAALNILPKNCKKGMLWKD